MSRVSQVTDKPLEEVCDILDSLRKPVNSSERAQRKSLYPYYGANGLQGYIDDYLFDEPLILLAEDGGNFDEWQTRPIAYKISGKTWVNNHAHVLRPKADFDFTFVFKSLEHKDIRKHIMGGTRGKLNQGELRQIKIRMPSLAEQKKIGLILSELDTKIAACKSLVSRQTLLLFALRDELISRSKVGQESKLGDLFINSKEKGVDGVAVGSVTKDGIFPRDRLERRVDSDLSASEHLFARKGYLAYNMMRMWQGVVGLADQDYLVSPAYVVLKPKAKASPRYWFQAFKTEKLIQKFRAYSTGITDDRLRLYFDDFAAIKVLAPDLATQHRIAEQLEAAEAATGKTKRLLSKLLNLKIALMNDLLSGRVRVKV